MSPVKSYIYHKTYQEVKETVSLPKVMTVRKSVGQCGLVFSCSASHKLDDKNDNHPEKRKTFWSVWKFISALETQFDLIHQFQGAEITDLPAICF